MRGFTVAVNGYENRRELAVQIKLYFKRSLTLVIILVRARKREIRKTVLLTFQLLFIFLVFSATFGDI